MLVLQLITTLIFLSSYFFRKISNSEIKSFIFEISSNPSKMKVIEGSSFHSSKSIKSSNSVDNLKFFKFIKKGKFSSTSFNSQSFSKRSNNSVVLPMPGLPNNTILSLFFDKSKRVCLLSSSENSSSILFFEFFINLGS